MFYICTVINNLNNKQMSAQIEILKEIIDNTDNSILLKSVLKGKVERTFEKEDNEINIINSIKDNLYKGNRVQIVDLWKIDESNVIFKIINKDSKNESEKYQFNTFNIEKNEPLNQVSNDFETQFLITMQNKYLKSSNSDFVYFVSKMLGK